MQVRGWWLALAVLAFVLGCEGSDGGDGNGGGPDVIAQDTAGPADTGGPAADTAAPTDTAAPSDTPAPPADVPVPPEDVPAPPADVPAPPEDVPPPPEDVPAPPVDVPVVPDVPGADVPPPPADRLTVDCAVPYILDGALIQDMGYITMHFEHLVQRYCITGSYQGSDITAYPEKFFYGSQLAGDDVLSLTQISLENMLSPPAFSVRIDFFPDTDVLPGSVWDVSADGLGAMAVLLGHPSAQTVCLRALGSSGSLTFGGAVNVTQEGGSFRVAGTVDLTPARAVEGACELFAESGLPCCD